MLDSSKKKTYGDTKVVTIIGPGTILTGDVKCKGRIQIEGEVHGRVYSDDTIMVQESGVVKADLIAGEIVIGGQVKGNIFAHERLEIMAKGRLLGDITAPRLSIAEGVLFEGKCTMKPPDKADLPSMEAAAPAPPLAEKPDVESG